MALVPDQKFSTFQNGGDLAVGDIIVGLRAGLNTKFNYTGELPPGVVVPISNGGTGATTAVQARVNLGLGTIATQDANAIAITGGTISGVAITTSTAALTSGSVVAAPSAGIDITNKTYVDSLIPTGAALTKVDDTNVTLTLGGTPATALLKATSLTLGWTGQLGLTRGGTAASLTASNGGIVYSTASALAILAGTATATQMLQSGSSGTPAWSTTTWPATSTINQILYSSAANSVTGLSTANSAILTTNGSGVPALTGPLANGQLLIGSTGARPVVANLTAGSGISISNTAGGITISGTGSGTGFTEVTGTTQAMVADAGYVTNNAGLVTLTLPAIAAFGTSLTVVGKGAGGWLIAQNSGQNIQVGNQTTTTGVGGSLASSNRYDSIDLVCVTANTTWVVWGAPQSAGLTFV